MTGKELRDLIYLIKRPILISVCILFAASTLLLIMLYSLPHATKYEYRESNVVAGMDSYIGFKDNGELKFYLTYHIGNKINGDMFESDYEIKDGSLYKKDSDNNLTKIGKISPFKIELDKTFVTAYGLVENTDIVLTSSRAIGLRTFAIILMSVFGAGIISCLGVLIADNKGKINYKRNKEKE